MFSSVSDGLVRVSLDQISLVHSRWGMETVREFNVKGNFLPDGSIRPLPYQPRLSIGVRYLFLLRGGPWRHAPVTTLTDGILEFTPTGALQCPGGLVFGLHPAGLYCSLPEHQVGAPPSEATLLLHLRKWFEAAKARRPQAQPTPRRLELLPTGDTSTQ